MMAQCLFNFGKASNQTLYQHCPNVLCCLGKLACQTSRHTFGTLCVLLLECEIQYVSLYIRHRFIMFVMIYCFIHKLFFRKIAKYWANILCLSSLILDFFTVKELVQNTFNDLSIYIKNNAKIQVFFMSCFEIKEKCGIRTKEISFLSI